MLKRLSAEPLYHPSGGMNIDANGIVARPNECIDAVNIDIDTDRVVQRSGSKTFPIPSAIGPILKFHRYIHPTRGSLLFAFTSSSIYQYKADEGWVSIYSGSSFTVNSWSVTDIVDKVYGSTVVAAGCTYTRPTQGYSDAGSRVLLIYDNQEFYSIDGLGNSIDTDAAFSGYLFLGEYYNPNMSLEVEFSTGDPNPITAAGWVAYAYDAAGWIGIRVMDSTTARVVAGGSYLTAGEYVEISIVEGVRINVRVNSNTGEVYVNGALEGTCSVTASTTASAYPLMFLHEVGAAAFRGRCYIYQIILDGTTWIADGTNERFWDFDNPTTYIYNQFNSIFTNLGNIYKWTESSGTAGEYYLELFAGGDPGLTQPIELQASVGSNFDSKEGTPELEVADTSIGSLNAGEWSWGDAVADSLGFDTVYWNPSTYADPQSYGQNNVRIVGSDVSAYNNYATADITGETVDVAFIDLEIKKNLYDDETYDLTSGPAASDETITAPGINTYSLTAERTIVSHSAYLVAEGIGVIATASFATYKRTFGTSPNYEERNINRWIPVDENEITYGDDSYIDQTTGDFSVDFILSTYDGLELTIYYQYEEVVDYKPIHVSNYHNTLVFANTAEFFVTSDAGAGQWVYTPWRVRWSEQNNVRLFKELNYQDLALDDITPILGMKALETEASSQIVGPLYFLKHNSIVRGTYNQTYNLDPNFPVPLFNFEIAASEGLESTNTAANIDGSMFYLGRNDVYAFDGINRVSLTKDFENGNTRIQRKLINGLDINYLYRNFAVYDEINRKYYLFVVLKTSTTSYPEDCFVYDVDGRYWVRHTYNQVSAAIDAEVTYEGTIDGLVGTIDGLGAVHIDNLTNNPSKILLFGIGDYAYFSTAAPVDESGVNDTPVESYFITRDFLGTTLEEQDRVQKVMVEATGGKLGISYNAKYAVLQSKFLQADTLAFGAEYDIKSYHPDSVVTAIRFKLDIQSGTEFRWMQVFSNKQELIGE